MKTKQFVDSITSLVGKIKPSRSVRRKALRGLIIESLETRLPLAFDVQMIKDINTERPGSNPLPLVQVGTNLFFEASTQATGFELWKSDGTASGTVMVKDIRPGAPQSRLSYALTNVNGTLFFRADDGIHGYELWKSDGTSAGTVMVKDIQGGALGSDVSRLTNVNGVLYFVADDGTNGFELWKSDGTASGTVMVKNIRPGSADSMARTTSTLFNSNGTLFFTANDGTHGLELWKSDGTASGTLLVKDIQPGLNDSGPRDLINVGDTLYFGANDGTSGYELWKSNGTLAGTVLVKDIRSGVDNSSPRSFTQVGGTLFFVANDGINGIELWKSDGTSAGTTIVKNIAPSDLGSVPVYLTNVNGTLYFRANDSTHGRELWKSDGTDAGTVMVKDVWSGLPSSDINWLTNVSGTLYFRANDGSSGTELWKSDGTSGGTALVRDIRTGSMDSLIGSLTNVNGTLFFRADGGVNGYELWKSNGTLAGTIEVRNIRAAAFGSFPNDLTNVNGTLFFTADDGINGKELWKSDGSTSGTVLVRNIRSAAGLGSDPGNLTNINGTLFLRADDGTNGLELWKSDGTAEGTRVVKDVAVSTADAFRLINNGTSFAPIEITNVNGILYFPAHTDSLGTELWKTDGTSGGTALVKDISPGPIGFGAAQLTNVNGMLYFVTYDKTNGTELWKSDGTASGTVMVKDIFEGTQSGGIANSSYPEYLTNINGTLYFRANDGSNGFELWRFDGTASGTKMVKDIKPGAESAGPEYLTNVNGMLYFAADDGSRGFELWKSDGTAAGTVMVKDIRPGASEGSRPWELTNVNGTLYFAAHDGVTGKELWKSDSSGKITDRRAGRISSEESAPLAISLRQVKIPGVEIFVEPVKEHRFVVVFRAPGLGGNVADTDPQKTGVPPLDPIAQDEASKRTAEIAKEFLGQAKKILAGHPKANFHTMRGFANKPSLPGYREVYGLRAAAIAVYPMYKGLARLVGMAILGSAQTLAEQMDTLEKNWNDYDFFFIHFKYTDSTGEDGDFLGKVARIEELDSVLPRITALNPTVMIVTGDHSTPSYLKSHSWHPVPTLLVSDCCRPDPHKAFNESTCITGGLGQFEAQYLMPLALSNAGRMGKYGASGKYSRQADI